jgi:hypothetical protein
MENNIFEKIKDVIIHCKNKIDRTLLMRLYRREIPYIIARYNNNLHSINVPVKELFDAFYTEFLIHRDPSEILSYILYCMFSISSRDSYIRYNRYTIGELYKYQKGTFYNNYCYLNN